MSVNVISAIAKPAKRGLAVFGDRAARNTVSHGYSRLQDGHYSTASARRDCLPANPRQCNTTVLHPSTHGVNATARVRKRSREETTDDGSSCSKSHKAAKHVFPSSQAALKADVDQVWIAELILLGQSIHREKQRRYMKKRTDKLAYLETSTEQVRVEVADLEQKRNNIVAGFRKRVNMWHVAVEYLWLFRHGLQPQRQTSPNPQADAQLDFVQKTMAADVACNNGFGQVAAIRSCWWFLQWFDLVDIDLNGLEKMSNYSLMTATRTALTITEQTLQKLFPHLSTAAEGDCAHKLASKLVGQRITMKGSVYFEFDELSGHVTRISAQSDMLTPMLQLLGSLANVAFVFEKALISPSLQWKASIVP